MVRSMGRADLSTCIPGKAGIGTFRAIRRERIGFFRRLQAGMRLAIDL